MRSVFLTLAILALVVRIIVPQGFMVSNKGGGFRLIVCPGHSVQTDTGANHDGSKEPSQKKSDSPCAFAGGVTPPAPSHLAVLSEPYTVQAARIGDLAARDLAPGRGLAAPPPPSQGPPAASI